MRTRTHKHTGTNTYTGTIGNHASARTHLVAHVIVVGDDVGVEGHLEVVGLQRDLAAPPAEPGAELDAHLSCSSDSESSRAFVCISLVCTEGKSLGSTEKGGNGKCLRACAQRDYCAWVQAQV